MSHERPRGASRRAISMAAAKARPIRDGLLAAATLACGLCAGPVLADDADAVVDWINHPSIIVESNGHEYTGVKNSSHSIEGKIRVHVDAEVTGRVESWFAWPELYLSKSMFPGTGGHDFQDSGVSKNYNTPRPKEVNESFNFAIARQDYEDFVVVACNLHRDHLRDQNKTDGYIFGENRILKVFVSATIEAEMTGPDRLNPPPQEVSSDPSLNVVCERDLSKDPVALDPAPTPIKDSLLVALTAKTNRFTGECELQVSGTIVTQEPNVQIKFRYYSDKGQQSDLKTVTTDDSGFVNFLHIYPLAKGSKQSGKVQMIGASHAFMSNWADFAADCSAPPQDIKTVLPPKALHLEAIATADKVMYRGLVCPAKVKVWGIILGRGAVEGHVALAAAGKPEALEPYDIEDGQQVIVQGEHELTWEGLQSPQQNVKYAMYVTNKQGDVVDQMEATQNFVCREPQVSDAHQGAPGGVAGDVDLPKSTNLLVSELGKKTQNGYVCPAKGRVSAFVQSDAEGFSGTLAIFAGGSLRKEIAVDLPANHGTSYPYDYELPWNGSTIPSQHVVFAMKVLNKHGHQVASKEKIEGFDCTKIETTGVAQVGGGYATEPRDPLPSQQGRPVATGQLAVGPALAIMAPKGSVRSGQIRLTGGPANTTYELSFYRKSSGGYQLVKTAKLPKQMTGLTATFDLAALTGGRDWRLEVCPAKGGQGTCKTCDFRLPVVSARQQKTSPAPPPPFVLVSGGIPPQ